MLEAADLSDITGVKPPEPVPAASVEIIPEDITLPKFDLKAMSRQQKETAVGIIQEKRRRFIRREAQAGNYVPFIQLMLTTFDPRPDAYPHHLPFKLYPYQKFHVREIVESIRTGVDLFDEKSRDMGISWLVLSVLFGMWIFEDGFQALLGSRKEDYVDNGTLDSLYGKFDYFIEHIKDPLILPKGFDSKKHRTYMKLANPENGNMLKGESSNKNFSRGGRYKVVFFDEFGFWPDARQSWTAAGDATKCRLAVTTPPDEPSFAKVVRFSGQIKVVTLHWRMHPKKDDAWYDYERGRRTEDEVLHELDISWEYTSTGRPYPEVDQVKFGQWGYDPTLPLYASIDLGLDGLAIGWYQPVKNSDWVTLIDAYETSGKVIDWALPLFGKDIDPRHIYDDATLKMIEQVKYWKPPILYGDPSGNAAHIESNKSAYTIMAENGLPVQVNTMENTWPPRRDKAKMLLMRVRVNDTPRTKWWMDCMKNARYPKRDADTSQSTAPITKPVHDWTSHHRTQFEFFAVNYRPKSPEVVRHRQSPLQSLIY